VATIGGPHAIAALVAILDKEPGEEAKEVASKHLDRLGWTPPDARTRVLYDLALKRTDDILRLEDEAVDPLIEAIAKGIHCDGAAEALAALKPSRAVEPLIAILQFPLVEYDWARPQRAAAKATGRDRRCTCDRPTHRGAQCHGRLHLIPV